MVSEFVMPVTADDAIAKPSWLEQRAAIAILERIHHTVRPRLQMRDSSVEQRFPPASLWMIGTD